MLCTQRGKSVHFVQAVYRRILLQQWRQRKKERIIHNPGYICRFAIGFCKNKKKRTETLYQSSAFLLRTGSQMGAYGEESNRLRFSIEYQYEIEGILCVFPNFRTARMGQKTRCSAADHLFRGSLRHHIIMWQGDSARAQRPPCRRPSPYRFLG